MKSGQTVLTIKDCDDFDFSSLDGRNELVELSLENVPNLQQFGQIPELPNLQALSIDSCPNLISMDGLKFPKLSRLHIKHCDSVRDYAPLNELPLLANLTIHTKHPSLNGLSRSNRPNLTVFVTVEEENGSYQKCFRSESDIERSFEDSPKMNEFINKEQGE